MRFASLVASLLALLAADVTAATVNGWTDITPPTKAPPAWSAIRYLEAGDSGSVVFVHALTTGEITDTGSWLRSSDGGSTWSPAALPSRASAFAQVRPVPGQPMAILALQVTNGSGLWLSNDAGAAWQDVPTSEPPPDQRLWEISPVGPQPGIVYGTWRNTRFGCFAVGVCIITNTAIRSTDGGRTWTSLTLAGGNLAVHPAVSDATTVYAASSMGIFRTRNSGASWEQVRSTDVPEFGAPGLAVDRSNPLVVYAAIPERDQTSYWVTEDGGDHWREMTAPTPSFDAASLPLPDPVDARRAFIVNAGGDIFETRDAGRTWSRHAVGSSEAFRASDWRVTTRGAARSIIAMNSTTVRSIDLSQHPIALGSDLWFNPAQPGWGLSIVQHETYQMFAVWFTYDAAGRPTWRFIPGGTWTDANTFTGTLYVSSVPPRDFFVSPFVAPTVTAVGTAQFRFTDANSGEATFTLDDRVMKQPISRMAFGPIAKTQRATADLWFNPAQSGWGIGVHQQYSTVFATWFLYDNDGLPTWFFMPDATSVDGYVSGNVYRATTSPGAPYEARAVTVTRAGDASLSTNSRVMSATIYLRSWASAVARLPF